ncbi:MAG TPA: DUF2442 domain-containing protein [Rhizobiaceae bacterium]|nr:DUF2442 domain-containing protein [Rhizobiaceae bacterium]
MIEYVDVVAVKPIGDYRVWVQFSNGREGVRDFSAMIAGGGEMIEPLRDKGLFQRVFVQHHAPTWPNGYAIDATNLHMEMEREHLLSPAAAAE